MLNKVLNKTKEIINIQKFDDNKIFIDTDDKLPDHITLINVILMRCAIKNDVKFYSSIFSKGALLGA